MLYTKDIENIIKNAHFYLDISDYIFLPGEQIEENKEVKKEYIEIKGSKILQEFLDYMKKEKKIEVRHCEMNGKIIYDKKGFL